jgi:hypothetical protein
VEVFFAKLGRFDHLVYTAGDSLELQDLAGTNLKKARRAFELRYWSALAAVKYGSPSIDKGGSIVLTTGIAGQRPHKGWVCRKCMWNHRSPNARSGSRAGTDSRKRSLSRSRSDEPLAEHERSRARTHV